MRHFIFLVSILGLLPVFAQHNIPEKDHFWRKRITQRIDLTMPVNAHLRTPYYNYRGVEYDEIEGLVPALLNGLRKGKFKAYHPDSQVAMDYHAVYERMEALEIEWTKKQAKLTNQPLRRKPTDEPINEWETIEVPADETLLAAATPTAQPDENSFLANVYNKVDNRELFFPHIKNIDFEPYLIEVQYVEDWIFDKMSSKMIYDIEYIKVIRYNEKDKSKSDVLALFKYDEVMEYLQKTLCKPAAESEKTFSMRQVFEERVFKFYVTNVSGRSFNTIEDAENQLQTLMEFESYLWTNEGDKIK